jgi:hypothetical protein
MMNFLTKKSGAFASLLLCVFLAACEKEMAISVGPNQPLLVVEAYINNLLPQYNYVVLSQSQDFFSSNFQSTPVSNAIVTVTEGEYNGSGGYLWNNNSTVRLQEANTDSVPASISQGLYFDQRLYSNRPAALKGIVGKAYLLNINVAGENYSAITRLVTPVDIDSLTQGFAFINDTKDTLYRITNHYHDPDTLGNAQFYFWGYSETRQSFGWGSFTKSRAPGTDDLSNGQYIQLTHPQGFYKTDTINYFMASITRDVYNFWDSYNKAKDNNGPFSTPVNLLTTVKGNNATGCFSGMALSNKRLIIR